jgi:hypothetical protein
MKISSARFHPIPTSGEEFLVSRSELRSAVDECLRDIRAQLLETAFTELLDGGQLLELEKALHHEVARCLDLLVARVIQAAHFGEELLDQVSELVALKPHLRMQDRGQHVNITLLGGTQVEIVSPYMLHRPKKKRGRKRTKRGKSGNGFYPVLELLGIRERVTPALASSVARQLALGSVSQTEENLAELGIQLDRKRLHSIALSVGERALLFRQNVIGLGLKPKRSLVQGATIVIGVDGGRLRTRKRKKGRKRESGHHGFDAEWREPKVLVIYEVDEKGRKKKGGYQRYDATLENCDAVFALIAGYLRTIGADKAATWAFVGDGAPWIWERVQQLCDEVGFDKRNLVEIVDFYHAKERLHAFAAEVKSWSKAQRDKWLKNATKLLQSGRIDALLGLCSEHYRGCNSKKRRKLAEYFETNRERMRYHIFRRRGLPMGSGAVESCVRRLVNLRLKGNGIFWNVESAEAVLQLRAQLLSGRWEQFMKEILQPVEYWEAA